jgi:hypothetical protein
MIKMSSVVLVALLSLAAFSGVARADESADLEQQAAELFSQGKYEDSLAQASKLLVKTNNPKYYRLVARCHQMLGHNAEAIRNFQLYLENASVDEKKKKETQGFIDDLKRQEAEKAKVNQAPPPVPSTDSPPPPPPAPTDGQSPVIINNYPNGNYPNGGEAAPPQQAAPPPAPPASPAVNGLQIAGLVAGGAGVVSIVVGAIFGAQAKDSATQINAKAVPGASYDSSLQALDDKGRGAQTKEWVFLGVGAAALVGGAVLFVVGSQHSEAPATGVRTAALVPVLSPRDVGASLTVRF